MSSDVRGIRNNNPGNLRPGRYPWLGQTFVDGEGYCVFQDWQKGVRAMVRNLAAYRDWHHLNTVEGIISRWAPSNENDTAKYIAFIVKHLGVADKKTPLDLKNYGIAQNLIEGIIQYECGKQPYDSAQIANIVAQNLT
jgi:hypothetical protein